MAAADSDGTSTTTAIPPLDPEMARIIAEAATMPRLDLLTTPLALQRRAVEMSAAVWNEPRVDCAEVVDLSIPTAAGPMRARLYRPESAPGDACVLYAHGGGWTFGSIDTHDGVTRRLAAACRLPVLAIDYRLAPENPFPAPRDDTLAAIAFLETGGLGAPIPASRLVVAGDSAGAQTVLAALIARRDRGLPSLAAGLLFYGCLAPDFDTDSHRAFGAGAFVLTTEQMRWYWSNHLAGRLDDPREAAPLRADLAGLPPLFLDVASHDCLRDDSLRLAERLAAVGVPHCLHRSEGVIHGYLRFASRLPQIAATLGAAGAFAREALGET